MRQTLADLFGFQARWENQDRDIYVLRRIEDRAALRESGAETELVQMMRGKITLRRQPVSKLCDVLKNALHAALVDETRMDRNYDFDLPYLPGQPEVTIQALRNIGFEATKARRSIRILVVSPEGAAKQQ